MEEEQRKERWRRAPRRSHGWIVVFALLVALAVAYLYFFGAPAFIESLL